MRYYVISHFPSKIYYCRYLKFEPKVLAINTVDVKYTFHGRYLIVLHLKLDVGLFEICQMCRRSHILPISLLLRFLHLLLFSLENFNCSLLSAIVLASPLSPLLSCNLCPWPIFQYYDVFCWFISSIAMYN